MICNEIYYFYFVEKQLYDLEILEMICLHKFLCPLTAFGRVKNLSRHCNSSENTNMKRIAYVQAIPTKIYWLYTKE